MPMSSRREGQGSLLLCTLWSDFILFVRAVKTEGNNKDTLTVSLISQVEAAHCWSINSSPSLLA